MSPREWGPHQPEQSRRSCSRLRLPRNIIERAATAEIGGGLFGALAVRVAVNLSGAGGHRVGAASGPGRNARGASQFAQFRRSHFNGRLRYGLFLAELFAQFPIDKIKIDRSFVSELGDRREAMAIVRAVAGLGSSLGIATTAEGVETAEQIIFLRREGCTEMQCYAFSPPRPAGEVEGLLNSGMAKVRALA